MTITINEEGLIDMIELAESSLAAARRSVGVLSKEETVDYLTYARFRIEYLLELLK